MATTPKTTYSNGTLVIIAVGTEQIKTLNDFTKTGLKTNKQLTDFCTKHKIEFKAL